MTEKACRSCDFWDRGSCRRYPPQPSPAYAEFPSTADSDLCGEYRSGGHREIDLHLRSITKLLTDIRDELKSRRVK